MKSRLGVIAVCLSVGVVLLAILLGRLWLLPRLEGKNNQVQFVHVNPISAMILRENSLPGTSNWRIPNSKGATIEIQAYASATSVSPGENLIFYVSTRKEGITYSLEIYRLGWYGGSGGRLAASASNLIGFAQGYYDTHNNRLVNCSSCFVDSQTGLIEANWLPSYTLTVPSNWISGVYLAKFIDTQGMQTYVPFDVRGTTPTAYIAVTPDTTYAAYNFWGGYSLYKEANDLETGSLGRGVKVSFDRPYTQVFGSGDVLSYEADAIHWLEHQGYDISYISNVDLHENPAQLLQHRVYISLGHDEYWTKEMRDGVERARDSDISLAFLGANAAYWQMRFEPDQTGKPDRVVVCYKVETSKNDLARDPYYGVDNSRVTALWRDQVLNRPENALIGIMYSNLTLQQQGFPWQVSPLATSPLLAGTSLKPGQQYGCGLVGYEWDRIFTNGKTPQNLQILGISSTVDNDGNPDISNTVYYIAPDGAMVFATGSIYWSAALDDYRLITDDSCTGKLLVIPGMQKLMSHVMDALVNSHA